MFHHRDVWSLLLHKQFLKLEHFGEKSEKFFFPVMVQKGTIPANGFQDND